jgi:hypothetical protein
MARTGLLARALTILLVLGGIVFLEAEATSGQATSARAAEGVPPDLAIVHTESNDNDSPGSRGYGYGHPTFVVTNIGQWWVGPTTAAIEATEPFFINQSWMKADANTAKIPDLDPKGQEGENPSSATFSIDIDCPHGPTSVKVTLAPATDWAGDVETNLANNTVEVKVCTGQPAAPKPAPSKPTPTPAAQPAPKPAPAPPGSKSISLSPSATRSVEVYRTHDTLSGWSAPKAIGNLLSDTPVAGWGQDEDGGHVINSTGAWIYQTAVQFKAANPLEAGKATNITKATVTFGESALYWTSGSGAAQDKPDGCVVVRVPSGDWVKSPPALLIPFITDARSPAPKKLGPREWDVTQAFRWQYDPANRGILAPGATPPPIGFGFLLTGEPALTSLNADDDTRCTSTLSDIKLNLTFTVEDPGDDDLHVH